MNSQTATLEKTETKIETVTLMIDGNQVTVPKGTTLLEAAQTLGIDIPTFCYLKELAPDGSCRMCVVEVEGGRKGGLVTSCTEHAAEGQVIHTRNKKVDDSRRFVMDLLLSNHKAQCKECETTGECELHQRAREYGVEHTSFTGPREQGNGTIDEVNTIDDSNPFFTFDASQCIMCRRCSRVCQMRQGRDIISIARRGMSTKMTCSYDENWSLSDCESCGNCVSVCPTGALHTKDTAKLNIPELKSVRTTCPHCGTGCQFDLQVNDQNRIVGVEPADGASNKNLLCVKGKFASYKFVHSGDRLKTPLIKRNGVFEEASWDEALTLVTKRFDELKRAYGSDSLAGFACSRSTNEDNYVFQKMMRTAFGTNNIDNCARLCHSATVHGLAQTFGSGSATNTIEDMTAPDVDMMLLIGSNTTEAHPVIGAHIRRAVQNGMKLVVVDPRKTNLARHCYKHLQIKAGTNVAFANGIMNVIITEGLQDDKFIAERTEDYEAMKEVVADYTPVKVAEICGISAADIIDVARLYATSAKAPIAYCLGVTEHSTGTEGVMSMSNMAMLVGKVGKPGCGVNPLRGQNNVQGACDMGCSPFDFPGYQKVANAEVVVKFEKAWNIPLNPKIGKTSTQVLPAAIAGDIKGLYIFGEDPIVSDPDVEHVRKSLESLDFLVVQELFMTETAEYADVVLPGISYAEKDGTFTNCERRIQRVRKAIEPADGLREDFKVFCEVSTRMGYPMDFGSASDIMDEIAAVTPTFAGVSFEHIEREGSIQWPCTSDEGPGETIRYAEEFVRPGGKGLFKAIPYKPAKELPDEDYPFLMTTGRMLYHYNTRAMTKRTEGIVELGDHTYIEINYEDANILGIKDGDKVKVSSRRGSIETYAIIGDTVMKDEVFMTFHFPDGNVNEIASPLTDDIAFIPEYKVCAVSVEPIKVPFKKLEHPTKTFTV